MWMFVQAMLKSDRYPKFTLDFKLVFTFTMFTTVEFCDASFTKFQIFHSTGVPKLSHSTFGCLACIPIWNTWEGFRRNKVHNQWGRWCLTGFVFTQAGWLLHISAPKGGQTWFHDHQGVLLLAMTIMPHWCFTFRQKFLDALLASIFTFIMLLVFQRKSTKFTPVWLCCQSCPTFHWFSSFIHLDAQPTSSFSCPKGKH